MTLDRLLFEWNLDAIPDERDMAECLDLAQAELDRIEAMIEKPPAIDPRIVIRVDNKDQLFRFTSPETLADWIVNGWKYDR